MTDSLSVDGTDSAQGRDVVNGHGMVTMVTHRVECLAAHRFLSAHDCYTASCATVGIELEMVRKRFDNALMVFGELIDAWDGKLPPHRYRDLLARAREITGR